MDDECIRNTVESVLAEFVLFSNGLVDGVSVNVGRHGSMERRVEVGDIPCMREQLGSRFNNGECGEVVSITC